ncbi:MAG: hypothetical protein ABL866_14955 [Devosia sp.]
MKRIVLTALTAVLCAAPMTASAEQVSLNFGGDTYSAGQTTTIADPVARDAFAAGSEVSLTAPVAGSAHLAGFNVTSNAEIGGDVYAMGYSVTVTNTVHGDVTAAGNLVTLRTSVPLPGNARLAGATILIDSPVEGSVLASAGSMTLNTAVTGDFSFFGDTLTFGPGAKVSGKLSIHAPAPVTVPESVASADRVSYQVLQRPDYGSEAGKTAGTVINAFWPVLWAAVIGWGFLFVVGIAGIALLPRLTMSLEIVSVTRPIRKLGLGLLSFAAMIGLVPVALLTLIGIFVVPFVLIFVVLAISVAYLVGVYLVGVRIGAAFSPIDSNTKRAIVLAVALVAGGLLTLVPFLGWFFTLAFLAYGFGIMSALTIAKWGAADAARLDSATPPAAQPAE